MGEVLPEHKSSVEATSGQCQFIGTAAEERSSAVYAEVTSAGERCVTKGHQQGLKTSGSDSEVKFLS